MLLLYVLSFSFVVYCPVQLLEWAQMLKYVQHIAL